MKITEISKKITKPLIDLDYGDVFRYNSHIYIKTNLATHNNTLRTCISLSNGSAIDLNISTLVEYINSAELIIKD